VSLFRGLFERRSIGSEELMRYLSRGVQSVSGQSVSESSAMRVAAVYACVTLIAGTLATLPMHVYERVGDRDRRRRDNHPVAILFRKPNRWQTRVDFCQQMQSSVLLRGNGYALIQWDGTTPREMWPLHPDAVEVERGRDLSLRYHVRMDPTSPTKIVQPEDMFHVRGLSSNGFTGRSVLGDAADVIGIAQATQEHAGTFWADGGGPDVVLKHPKTLSQKAKTSLEEHWEATYGGGKGQRRVAVLEEGMDVSAISLTKQDAQFLETRKFQRGEIAGIFQVPPHMIGDTEKSTSWGTGIEQQQIGFVQYTMRRWLVTWEQAIWQQFIEAEQAFYPEFNVDGLLRGDLKTRMDSYALGITNGVYSVNDVRRKENESPVEGGDTYWRQLNLAPLTQIDTPDAPADPVDSEDDTTGAEATV
jgi:HK97 family phage portal protein